MEDTVTLSRSSLAAGPPVGVLCIGSRLFSGAAANSVLKRTRASLERRADGSAFLPPAGLVIDRQGCAEAVAQFERAGAVGLAVQLSTFAPAELLHDLVTTIGERPLSIVLWGLEETDEIATNSLCGVQLWGSTLHRFGRPFTLILGNPEDERTERELAAFAAAARARSRIVGSRVALIGSHAEWFTNLAVDPWMLKRLFDVTVEQLALVKFIEACEAAPEQWQASAALWTETAFKGEDPAADRATLGRTHARLATGLARIKADAIAIRDWPEILYDERFRGTWPALGELSDNAVPVAPEGDVMAALTALAIRAFNPGSLPFLTDISGFDRQRNRLVLWHYGVSPRLAAGPRSVNAALKEESFPLRPGPLTLIRISLRPDGTARLFVAEGEIETDVSAASRAAGFFRPDGAEAATLIRTFVERGYEHHVTAVHGRWGMAARMLGDQLGLAVDHV